MSLQFPTMTQICISPQNVLLQNLVPIPNLSAVFPNSIYLRREQGTKFLSPESDNHWYLGTQRGGACHLESMPYLAIPEPYIQQGVTVWEIRLLEAELSPHPRSWRTRLDPEECKVAAWSSVDFNNLSLLFLINLSIYWKQRIRNHLTYKRICCPVIRDIHFFHTIIFLSALLFCIWEIFTQWCHEPQKDSG